jgi:hypothetical protein
MFKILLAGLFFFTQVGYAGTQAIVKADLVDGVQTDVNYLKAGGHFEKNVNGWSLFDDGAATPGDCDGVGGGVVSTFARSTSSPLSGDASGLFTKSSSGGANTGEGVAYAFTIDAADKGAVLKINFDYITDTDFVDNDFRVWIYDVTNSRLIEPSPNYIKRSDVIGQIQPLEFQTSSDSTSYKVCLHIAGTTATAWDFTLDNLKIGRDVKSVGAFISEGKDIALTASNLGTGSATVTAKGTRRGDRLFIQGRVVKDGSAGTGASSVLINLPHTIDTTKLASGSFDTLGNAVNGNIVTNPMFTVVYNSTTSVRFYQDDDTLFIGSEFGANHAVTFQFEVPILGWSTNQVLSSDSGVSEFSGRMYLSANQTGVNPNNSYTKITFNTTDFDNGGGVNTASTRYDIKVSGRYRVSGLIKVSSTNVLANEYGAVLHKNGSPFRWMESKTPAVTTNFGLGGSVDVDLVAGEFLEMYIYGAGNNSVSTLTVVGGNSVSFLSVSRINSPQQIAATEFIGARYQTDTARSFADATTTYPDFEDKVFDTHNMVLGVGSGNVTTTATGWRAVIPAAGKYKVTAGYQMASGGGWAAGERFILVIRKNNTGFVGADQWQPAAHTTFVSNSLSGTVECVAGDVIELTVQQSSGAALNGNTNAAMNYIEIVRVGL